MNIGEQYYCSCCMAELNEEGTCYKCGYDPQGETDPNALEEGALLQGIRFQIGAVRKKNEIYIMYGAYDYLKQKPVYILEIYPDIGLTRKKDRICASCREMEKQFADIKARVALSITSYYEMFEDNNTIYFSLPIETEKAERLSTRQVS